MVLSKIQLCSFELILIDSYFTSIGSQEHISHDQELTSYEILDD